MILFKTCNRTNISQQKQKDYSTCI